MKKYIKSATLEGIKSKVIDVLESAPDVDYVEIFDVSSGKVTGRVHYKTSDAFSKSFTVNFGKKESRSERASGWNPSWKVMDDGRVVDSRGHTVGYFKLTKSKPTTSTPDYPEDTLEIHFGGTIMPLNESTADEVAEKLKIENSRK